MGDLGDRRPVYRRLRDRVAAEIARNTWRPGEPIASEAELARRYGVSVGTVRKAVDLLVGDGLVERVSGSGTFVRRPDFRHAFVRFTRLFGSAGERRVPESRILSREALAGPPEVTAALGLPDGAPLIRLVRLRVFEGAPVVREEIWLDAARFAPVLAMEGSPKLLYPVYEDLCGEVVARAEEEITVEGATPENVELLGLAIPALLATWHVTRAGAGLLGGVTLGASALGGWLGGALADRVGRVRALQATVLWLAQ